MARWVLLVAFSYVDPAAGAVISNNQTLNNEATDHVVVASKRDAWAESIQDASLGHTVASLKDVAVDLQQDEAQEDSDVKGMEKQIVALVRKRDAEKKLAARKAREIVFIHTEVSRLEAKIAARSHGNSVAAAAGTAAADSTAQDTVADAAGAYSSAAAADGSAAGGQDTSDLGEADAVVAEAEAAADGAAAVRSTGASTDGSVAAVATGGTRLRTAARAAASTAIGADRVTASAAQQRAAVRVQAQAAQRAQVQAESAEELRQEAKTRQQEEVADSADDSFKQFMKEEDGEDQMGDTDYEDSANALAGAIGWNRNEIEHKADDAVKQLTEAIGGKKVIKSIQGMMAGVR